VTGFRDRWDNAVRTGEQKQERAMAAALHKGTERVTALQGLPDAELIASAPVRTGLDRPDHEMEMQRRLKESVVALTAESRKARVWAAWGTGAMVALTIALIVLTVALLVKG
jgi:hypothetical protein